MNLAIILAVSKYKIPGNDLPACKKDGEIINNILTSSGKYDHVLYINDDQTSIEVKDLLGQFFATYREEDINEFFFYYSGHGDFSKGKFHYLLSDYDEKRKNQTTLENEEFDSLIRSLGAQLVVKVVDACHSGSRYIKDFDILPKYFNESKTGFNNCYFLYSSLTSQYSYQDDNLSDFTKSFVEAIKVHPTDEISFKHIIEYITDEFENIGEQTPFYVIQAQMTEKFLKYNKELKKFLKELNLSVKIDSKEEKKKISILGMIIDSAKEYVDQDGAIRAMQFCKTEFEKQSLGKEINELFSLSFDFNQRHNELPGSLAIGRWLIDDANDLFAKPTYEDSWYTKVDDAVLNGYEFLLEDAPFTCLTIEVERKYPNLRSYQCNIAFLVSKKQIYFFYSILPYLESGWNTKHLDLMELKWNYSHAKIAVESSIKDNIRHVYGSIEKKIKLDIEALLGMDFDLL